MKTKTARKGKKSKQKPGPGLKRIGAANAPLKDISKYERTKTASGNASLDSGDSVAKKLRGVELADVYKQAAKVLGEPIATLKSRYAHLNVGMQRMNLGNRIRGAQA